LVIYTIVSNSSLFGPRSADCSVTSVLPGHFRQDITPNRYNLIPRPTELIIFFNTVL